MVGADQHERKASPMWSDTMPRGIFQGFCCERPATLLEHGKVGLGKILRSGCLLVAIVVIMGIHESLIAVDRGTRVAVRGGGPLIRAR